MGKFALKFRKARPEKGPRSIWELHHWELSELLPLPWEEREARVAHIKRHGQPVRLSIGWGGACGGSLLVINTEPLPGFTHLVEDYLVEALTWHYGQYHISILRGGEWRDGMEEAVERLRRRWDQREVVLRVREVRGRACMELVEEGVAADPDLHLLRSQGFHAGVPVHVSG